MSKAVVETKNKENIEEIKNVPYPLPEGWKWVKLGNIAEINPKKNEILDLKNNTSFKVSFIPMNYVDDIKGEIIKQDEKAIKEVYKGYTCFKEGDIIFAKITPCMENGKCAIAKNLKNGIGFGSTEFHVIRVKENIFNKLIWFYLRLEKIRNEATKHFTGAVGHKRVPKDFLESLLIPLPFKDNQPDLEKQKQIVEKIENIFKEIDKAITLRQKALEDTKKLFESVLNKIFKEAENDKENWKWVRLENIAEKIKAGGTPSRKIKEYWENGTIPWVKISDISEKEFIVKDTEEKITEEGLKNSSAKLLKKGTLLFSIFATIGRVGILDINATTNQAIVGIELKNKIDVKFMAYILKYFSKDLIKISRGNAQNNINQSLLKNLLVPIPIKDNQPDLEKQKEIVKYLDNLHSKMKQLEKLQELQIEKFKQLKENILNKAFRGEFV